MSKLRIQHVSVPRPPGSGDTARRFYGDALGLTEIRPPRALAQQELVWFQIGDCELHQFAAEGGPHPGAHFCIEVDDLDAVRARLTAAGHPIRETTPIPGRPRFFCSDPFGNQIEIATITGDYHALEQGAPS
jgi:catechol 2,3-dioxygenase-like lactoylglutathione lyase family enzyme